MSLAVLMLLLLIYAQTLLVLILQYRQPAKAAAWIFVLLLIPLGGLVIYYFMAERFNYKISSMVHRRMKRKSRTGAATAKQSMKENRLDRQSCLDRHNRLDRRNRQNRQNCQHRQSSQIRRNRQKYQNLHNDQVNDFMTNKNFQASQNNDYNSSTMTNRSEANQRSMNFDAPENEHFHRRRLPVQNSFSHNQILIDRLREYPRLSALLQRLNGASVTYFNHITLYRSASSAYNAMLEAIGNAKQEIVIQFYIFRDDQTGRKFQKLLMKKASQGVKVRMLVDGIGSMSLKQQFFQKMREAGIAVGVFLPLLPAVLKKQINYRNHRKIVVVDGKIGFVGGMNIGDEYLGKDPKLGHWQDSHMRVTGEAAACMRQIFYNDWLFVTGNQELDQCAEGTSFANTPKYIEEEASAAFHSPPLNDAQFHRHDDAYVKESAESLRLPSNESFKQSSVPVSPDCSNKQFAVEFSADFCNEQSSAPFHVDSSSISAGILTAEHEQKLNNFNPVLMFSCGPDHKTSALFQLYFQSVMEAKDKLYIITPYFLPDEGTLSALKIAAYSGVDVRILVPGLPDNRLVHMATLSYVKEILEAGGKVYQYQKGFIHSKLLIADGKLAVLGTANLDRRSFFTNFELSAVLFHEKTVSELTSHFLEDLSDSKEMELKQFECENRLQRCLRIAARMISPLM